MQEFISEDDLATFEGWLRYQGFDAAMLAPDELTDWRDMFDKARRDSLATPKVGLMKLPRIPGEYRYAVAVRDGSDLWLTLWVKRSKKGEFFIMVPRQGPGWDVHTSYHLDGTMHMKSFGHKHVSKKLQPLTGAFKGTEHLGSQMGHGPKRVGAICDPADFSGVVEVVPGILGPRDGSVVVDLVEPNREPLDWLNVVQKEVFRDTVPWIVIRVTHNGAPQPATAELKSKTERRSRLLRISCSPSTIARSSALAWGVEPLAMDACLRASGANARLRADARGRDGGDL